MYFHCYSSSLRKSVFTIPVQDMLSFNQIFNVLGYQKKLWKFHKEECKGFQHVAPHIPKDAVVLMLRLILRFNVRYVYYCFILCLPVDLFIIINICYST